MIGHSSAEPGVADTRDRILEAAARCIGRDGVAGASMAAIALEAGVSKALLHYHYRDRARLLAEIVERIGTRLIARERAAIDGAADAGSLDALWCWLADELQRGELASIGELALVRDTTVRHTSRAMADRRRRSATQTVEQLFAQLQLVPRVPAAMMAEAMVAFIDGLVLDVASGSSRDPRVSFDLFWLGLLSLAD